MDALDPVGNKRVALPRFHLIGLALVFQVHQQIAIEHRTKHTVEQAKGDGKAGVRFQPRHAEGYDRDIAIPGLCQGLAQQGNIVGSTATATGLHKDEGGFMRIVLAAF